MVLEALMNSQVYCVLGALEPVRPRFPSGIARGSRLTGRYSSTSFTALSPSCPHSWAPGVGFREGSACFLASHPSAGLQDLQWQRMTPDKACQETQGSGGWAWVEGVSSHTRLISVPLKS